MRTSPVVLLAFFLVALTAAPAQAQSAGYGCSASAARLTVLGKTVEPVAANAGGATCIAETKTASGAAAALPVPLSVGTLVAATETSADLNAIRATGGVADFAISTASLPIALPQIPAAVTDALDGVLKTIDLTAVKSALPVLPTNLATDLVTNLPTNQVVNLLDPLLANAGLVAASNAANLATNTANAALNTANAATNAANAALNQVRASIPDSVTIDGAALRNLLALPSLPKVDLLRVRGAVAYASGTCQGANAVISGSSKLLGLSVLGQDLPLDQVLDQVKTLIPATPIDPTNVSISAANLGLSGEAASLISSVSGASTALQSTVSTVNATLQSALTGVGVRLPAVLAQVKVTPDEQIKTANGIVQRALRVTVTVAGQTVVDAIVGEARASAAKVDCGAAEPQPDTPEGAALECSTRKLVLVDVLERAGRVKLTGVAHPSLAGRTVSIVFGATGQVVARARVAKDGSFDTTAPLPRAAIRDTNAARYTAKLGKEESINLKLSRRMVLSSMTSRNGRVTIAGRVIPPLGKPLQAITLTRRVSCTEERVVTRFKPRSDGRFRITVKAPKGLGTAVYRMTTKVRSSATGSGLFETYTLPRAVDLKR